MQAQNAMGDTALKIASFYGNLDIVEVLLEANADVEIANNYSFAPIHVASQEGHVDVVVALLEAGAAVDRPKYDGATPLFIASQDGHVDLVAVLIEAGADVDKPRDTGATPLVIASQEGQSSVVSALLRVGADPKIGTDMGDTPLHYASATLGSDSEKITVDLLDAGAETDAKNAYGETPLIWAAKFGNIGATRLLLLRGADRTIEDMHGNTALARICACEEARGNNNSLQCPDGGCNRQKTIKTIRDLLT